MISIMPRHDINFTVSVTPRPGSLPHAFSSISTRTVHPPPPPPRIPDTLNTTLALPLPTVPYRCSQTRHTFLPTSRFLIATDCRSPPPRQIASFHTSALPPVYLGFPLSRNPPPPTFSALISVFHGCQSTVPTYLSDHRR